MGCIEELIGKFRYESVKCGKNRYGRDWKYVSLQSEIGGWLLESTLKYWNLANVRQKKLRWWWWSFFDKGLQSG